MKGVLCILFDIQHATKLDKEKKMSEWHESEFFTYRCIYKVVFCTRFARKVLNDEMQEYLKQLFFEIADKYNFKIISIYILENQIHLKIDCSPEFGVSEAIKKLKRESSPQIKDKFPKLKTTLPSIWTRTAFIASLRNEDEDVDDNTLLEIMKFVERQKRQQQ